MGDCAFEVVGDAGNEGASLILKGCLLSCPTLQWYGFRRGQYHGQTRTIV